MYYGQAEAGVGVLTTRTLRDRDVEEETTGTYARRVLGVNTPTPAPLHIVNIKVGPNSLFRLDPNPAFRIVIGALSDNVFSNNGRLP